MKSLGKFLLVKWLAVAFLALQILTLPSNALVLSDGNSIVDISPNTQAGIYNWTIDGQDILAQQWFWYRVGAGPGQNSLDTLPSTITQLSPSIATASYTGTSFVVSLTISLIGSTPGSGNSDLSIQASIKNTSGSAMTFRLYQYADFDLFGVPGDNVSFPNSNTVVQTGALGYVQEGVVTGLPGYIAPMHHEANLFPNTLNSLNSGSNYVLNDSNSAGPGDVTWAFEWDAINLGAGSSVTLSKNLVATIPEPATIWFCLLGLGGAALLRKRRA
jgi:hypothetical protein